MAVPNSRNISSPEQANILLVDDIPQNIEFLTSTLAELEQNLIVVQSPDEAVAQLEQREFAVILIDVRAADLAGFETAKRIRRVPQAGHTPIIFLTTDDLSQQQIERGYAISAVDFLVKPLCPIAVRAKVIGLVVLFQEKQKAKREAEQLRLLVQGTTEYAIFMLDPDGHVASWNPGARRIKGYSAEEIIGQHFSRFYPQEAVASGWPDHELRVATSEGRFEDEGWRVRKDGSTFWANVIITALRDADGNLRGFSKITRDMTDRKLAEENARRLVEETTARRVAEENAQVIQEQRERLRVTLESIGDAVISTDSKGNVAFLNPVAERLIGWKSDEVSNRALDDVFQIINESTRQQVDNPAMRALKEGVVVGLANHTVLIDKFGHERPIDDSAAPIRDANGEIIGSVLVFRDISERRRAEMQLREQTFESETLYRISNLLARELELERLVQLVTDEATHVCGAEFGAFFYNNETETGESYTLYTLSGVSREAFAGFPMPRNTAVFGPTFRGEDVIRLDDVTKDSRYGKNEPYMGMPAGHLPVRSYLAVPVATRSGEVLGGLFFGHSKTGVFTSQHERLVTNIASQAAIAIDNARLYQHAHSSAERLNLALAAADLGDWSWDAATDLVTLSNRAAEIFGIPSGPHMTWTKMQQMLHPDDRERARSEVARVIEEHESYDIDYRINRSDGRQVWIGVLGRAVYDSNDRAIGMYGVIKDISARKRTEQITHFLADASAALAVLVDFDSTLQKVASLAVPHFADWASVYLSEEDGSLRRVAVAHVDADKVVSVDELNLRLPRSRSATHGVWNILRTGRSELFQQISDEMLAQTIEDEDLLGVARNLRVKSYIGVPLKVRGKTLGVLTFISAEPSHLYDEADLAAAQELADRAAIAIENAQLYRELRDADRRKDEFLATLAHELRNPLAPIRNGLEVLRLAEDDAETVEQARMMMERQLCQMVRLVDDLLDVSRITRNKLDLRKQRVDLATVVHNAVETSRPLIEQAGHTFSMRLPADPIYLEADVTRLAQVFANLLNNAAKYTEPGGHISFEAERGANEVVVRVRDTGIGIPTDALPRIFEMFSQVDRNIGRAQGGLGIGLTLVRRLVSMHGGIVEARSDGPGRGSEFIVRLPIIDDEVETQAGASVEELKPTDQRRILVVDDNRDSATSLAMMLSLMGHETRTAHDGLAAVDMAESFRPDVILLDIGLPKLNGYDACRRIREQAWSNGMIIVALTGWGQEEDRRRSQQAGFDHHLVKPVEVASLETLLSEGPQGS